MLPVFVLTMLLPHLFEYKVRRDEPLNGRKNDKYSSDFILQHYTCDLPWLCVELAYKFRTICNDHQKVNDGDQSILMTEACQPPNV